MKINIDAINKKVKPQLNNGVKYLENAAVTIEWLDIPEDFEYINTIKKMPQNLRKIKININNDKKWIEDIAIRFEKAEKQNNSYISSLNTSINFMDGLKNTGATTVVAKTSNHTLKESKMDFAANKKYKTAEIISNNINNAQKNTGAKTASIWDCIWNVAGTVVEGMIKNTASKICEFCTGVALEISKGVEKIKEGFANFAVEGFSKLFEIKKNIETGLNCAGACISAGWNSFVGEVLPSIGNFFKSFGASVGNIVGGLLKGVCQFVESIFDFVVILGAGVATIFTGLYSGIGFVVGLANGDMSGWNPTITQDLWKDVMGYVAEDHVGNAYEWIYKETAVGQWLEENAWDLCKSEGTITNIASGIGYVAGIVILTIATLGVGGAAVGGSAAASGAATSAFTTTSAVIAASAATGKYTQESWGKMRDESWEGIERMHERGEITDEDYNTMHAIKFCTDEQWAEIEEEYKAGIISEEQYKAMKEIRERPEDWKTAENLFKGLGYGVANGLWEGIQWYVGGKLAGWAIKGQKIATAGVRVGVDTAFNGLDTPFRATIDAVTYGKTWDEAWEEQGGWQSVATNIGIGLIGSAGGEVFDAIKLKKASKILDNNEIFDNLDDATTKRIKDSLIYDQQTGKIDISKMTKEQLDEALNKKMLKNGINIIDKQHGYQLTRDDLGDFYKAKLQQGFFTEEQVDEWLDSINSKGYIDGKTGNILKELFDGDDRIFIKTIHSSDADSIMNEGIRCLGDSTSTGRPIPKDISDINLENTVTEITDGGLYELLTKLKSANGISQGGNPIDGAVIIRIPKDTYIEDIFKYNKELGLFNIDPKYNMGYFKTDTNGIVNSVNTINLKETIDNNIPKSSLFLDHKQGMINFNGMTDAEIENIIYQKINNRGTYSDLDYRFQYNYEASGRYGCDQGGISGLIKFKKPDGTLINYNSMEYNECIAKGIPLEKTAYQEYHDIKDYFMSKYKMSNRDASTFISSLDTIGACSYASEINDLISFYSNRQVEFEQTFGYPLYKKNQLGVWELNDKQLLADLFYFENHYNNGGRLLYTDAYGNTCVDYNNINRDFNGYSAINNGDNQNYVMLSNKMQDKLINKFLKSKGSSRKYSSKNINEIKFQFDTNSGTYIGTGYSNKEMNKIINKAQKNLNDGKELQMYIASTYNSEIRLIDMENNNVYLSTWTWGEGTPGEGAHAVKITGMTNDGFIVSSWGERLLVPYEDLQKSGAFTIFAGKYK